MPQAWEHLFLDFTTNDATGMKQALTDAGEAGWELAGITGVDRTLNVNVIVAILKRPGRKRPSPPNAVNAAWHPDPWGRHKQRYWNGFYWTQHVSDSPDSQSVDTPGD